MSRRAIDFGRWYETLHGYRPFPWQARLARRIAAGDWPDALTTPTGSGKTAIVDIWLWATLRGLDVPVRLVYVIDRRLVVDGVVLYARELFERLRKCFPDDGVPQLVTLRGGMTIDDEWVREPHRPTLVVSTIDQAGSRLLFSGYGISPHSASIHAALLGNDALWVLDEVHLARPLLRTMDGVARLRVAEDSDPGSAWRRLVMSATWDAASPHGLDEADRADPELSKRLNASKPAELVLAKEGTVVRTLVAHANRLRAEVVGQGLVEPVIGVVCNRVATARAVHDALSKSFDAVLLTGRIRPADRDALLESYLPRMKVGSRNGRKALFVVATQTIEVGADLDLDAMVTECAPLSSLRQRAGRVDRVGLLAQAGIAAPIVVVYEPLKFDAVYGGQAEAAYRWLRGFGKTELNFGLAHMEQLLERSPAPQEPDVPSPELLDAHVELLSWTSVRKRLAVDPWLHGWDNASHDVYVAWRGDLSESSVRAAPPRKAELLTIPLSALRRWSADIADLDGVGSERSRSSRMIGRVGPDRCVRWDGTEAKMVSFDDLSVGDTVVLDCRAGGHDRFGWAPMVKDRVRDLGDTVDGAGQVARLRLHASLLDADSADRLEALLEDEPDYGPSWIEFVEGVLERRGIDSGLAGAAFRSAVLVPYLAPHGSIEMPGMVVVGRSHLPSARAAKPVPLDEHQRAVSTEAARLADEAGVSADLAELLTRAGALHDEGKRWPSWQAMVGGSVDAPLAKGPGGGAGTLPAGWRHEVRSALATHDPIVRHLVGTHHGRGRPWLPAGPDPEAFAALGGWADRFADLQRRFGYWGLARMEMLLRIADWNVSAREQNGVDRKTGDGLDKADRDVPQVTMPSPVVERQSAATVTRLDALRANNPVAMMAALGIVELLPDVQLRWREDVAEVRHEGDLVERLAGRFPERRESLGQLGFDDPRDKGIGGNAGFLEAADLGEARWLIALASQGKEEISGPSLLLLGGKHRFVATARGIVDGLASADLASKLREALFGPWTYSDAGVLGWGWDANARIDPASSPKSVSSTPKMGVSGAYWLAWESLPMWPILNSRTVGFDRDFWRYPIWSEWLDWTSIRALVLSEDRLPTAEARARGVERMAAPVLRPSDYGKQLGWARRIARGPQPETGAGETFRAFART